MRIQPTALRRWIVAGTLATTAVGGGLLLIFARLQAGKAVWTDGFFLNGSQWFDAARTTVTLVGIIGLGGAAFLAYRKQVSTEAGHLLDQSTSLRDRYTITAEQLGHDSAAIRLAGVYALASLADDWHDFGNDDERQVCVDLLCAYLRTARSAERIDRQEENVRSAIIDVLAGRSRKRSDGMDGPWVGLRFALFGADLTRANLAGANLSSANLTGANLSSAGLVGVNLTRVDLVGANLASAFLFGANLTGANLTNANLNSANLTSMNLGAAQLRSTLAEANLTGASLVGAHLTGANLTGARLTCAKLTNTNLVGANLTDAILLEADLSGADLSGADLTGANLILANLDGANLDGANLTNAIYDTHTRWPEGFSPPGSISS